MRPRDYFIAFTIIAFVAALAPPAFAGGSLADVRYQKSGSGHRFLATEYDVVVTDRAVHLDLFLLADRYVAEYTESRTMGGGKSEVLVQRELAGGVSGAQLSGLGSLQVTNETKNGKPVVVLTLDQVVGVAPRGTTARLIWIYGSWAPKSVTGS